MSKRYFGFAIADSMFSGHLRVITRRGLFPEQAKRLIAAGVVSALNPSDKATIEAVQRRFGIDVPIPEKPPQVELDDGDSIVVVSVRGLPPLEGHHEYTGEEIAQATFSFSIYTVVG